MSKYERYRRGGVAPDNKGSGCVWVALEKDWCVGCLQEIWVGDLTTLHYSLSIAPSLTPTRMLIRGYFCRKCYPFRFGEKWDTPYSQADEFPDETK